VQRHHTVVGVQLRALAKERVVMIDADMLEHADRNDAVEPIGEVPIALQLEARAGPSPFYAARSLAIACCYCDSVMPVTCAPVISTR
jgi:hypothetical protein